MLGANRRQNAEVPGSSNLHGCLARCETCEQQQPISGMRPNPRPSERFFLASASRTGTVNSANRLRSAVQPQPGLSWLTRRVLHRSPTLSRASLLMKRSERRYSGFEIVGALCVTAVLAAPILASDTAPTHESVPKPIDFARDVQPILASQCYSCHGDKKQKAGLRLDDKEDALRGGDSGSAIVSGKSSDSLLIERIENNDASRRMPLHAEPLSRSQITTIRHWIDQGAHWPDTVAASAQLEPTHWSFRALGQAKPPPVADSRWPRNSIDRFVLARLERARLSPSPEADRRALIRRLSFDLLGLPPTPAEIDAFLHDQAADAYEHLVDRLLASPHYGEHWARHWLDVVRFAESHGFEMNLPRHSAWPYRDYVIAALNDDKPYDRFVQEQIAGDALGADAATGFLVGGACDQVKSPDPVLTAQQRADELHDIVGTTGSAFLGLTVGCARCHNHKFDPISQRDYYSLTAVFAGVQHGTRPWKPADWCQRQARSAELKRERAALERRAAALFPSPCLMLLRAPAAALTETLLISDTARRELCRLGRCRSQLDREIQELDTIPTVYAGKFEQPGPTHRLYRGDAMQPREQVLPAALESFGRPLHLRPNSPERQRRLALARWITDPRNPLTGRVMVNRIWLYHFGEGIVSTPSDFGLNGAEPSHPELLDWLARQFIAGGWRIKPIHRLIVCSATYRQASQSNQHALAVDAQDRLLWRFAPRRLEAEVIRDSMLAVCGNLNPALGGPGFDLFEANDNYVKVYNPRHTFGPPEWRRMIYQSKPRLHVDDVFGAFDCPDGGQIVPKRSRSTTPLQALNLLNSPFVMQQAGIFASRLQKEAGPNPAAQVRLAFQLAFGREPAADELTAALHLIETNDLSIFCRALLNANEFIYLF